MRKILNAALITSALITTAGATDLLIPREYGLNKVEQTALMLDTDEASQYARDLIPGTLSFYVGAATFSLLLKKKGY